MDISGRIGERPISSYNYTSGPTKSELFPLHFDVFEARKCLKVYVYLTDGDRKNGAFRYVPRSHRLSYLALPWIPHNKHQGENALSNLLSAIDQHVDLKQEPELRECTALLHTLPGQLRKVIQLCCGWSGGNGCHLRHHWNSRRRTCL